MSRWVKKPQSGAEWKSEELFRTYASINKIDVVTSQALLCLTCGKRFIDIKGACSLCGSKNFCRPDFFVRGEFPLFVNGNIHEEKQEIEDRDLEQENRMIDAGVPFMRITEKQLRTALAMYKK